jgi:anti-sigma B factor antagonist
MAMSTGQSLYIEFIKKDDNVLLIKVKGSVVDQNVEQLQKKLEKAYRKDLPQIILDISGIDFLNSMGLGVIIYIHTLMLKSGRQLSILNPTTGPSAYIDELFASTNLDKVLNIIR